MNPTKKLPRWAMILILILYSAALAAGAFLAGRSSIPEPAPADSVTFYAHIVEISGETGNNRTRVQVEGLEINDINYRGLIDFSVDESTQLVWRGTPLRLDELEPGDLVAVTHSGEVLLIYPQILTQVDRVQLLDDEK